MEEIIPKIRVQDIMDWGTAVAIDISHQYHLIWYYSNSQSL